jgi:hypothetical protein
MYIRSMQPTIKEKNSSRKHSSNAKRNQLLVQEFVVRKSYHNRSGN